MDNVSAFRLSKVHVHLEGGNLCDSDEACFDRCDQDHDGQVDNGLCTGPVTQAGSSFVKHDVVILNTQVWKLRHELDFIITWSTDDPEGERPFFRR